jgi:hypothetical protein
MSNRQRAILTEAVAMANESKLYHAYDVYERAAVIRHLYRLLSRQSN